MGAGGVAKEQKQVRKSQRSKTFLVTAKSIFAVCTVYLIFAIPSTLIYASVKDEAGNYIIQSNLVNNMPMKSFWGVLIKLLMWLSCICSEPVLLSSTSELLEKNCEGKERV